MQYEWLWALSVSASLGLLFTPVAIRIARLVGAIDIPGGRRIHRHPTPRLGGLAVAVGFVFSVVILFRIFPGLADSPWLPPFDWSNLLFPLCLVLALGIWDDIHPLTPWPKLLVQVLAGIVMYIGGLRIVEISVPLASGVIPLGVFSLPFTVLWIVGITNAFNLIDGLDGLAAGVALISALTQFAIASLGFDYATAAIAICLAGTLLGFLPYNFNGARIFLGDSGSLFLGFVLAALSIHGSTKGSTAFAIIVPVLALGLPVMDTLLAMVRRALRPVLPSPAPAGRRKGIIAAIMSPDSNHIHHRLLAKGFSVRGAVVTLYVVSCAFGILAFAVTTRLNASGPVLLVIGLCAVIGVRKLGYHELAILENGALLHVYQFPVVDRRLFQVILDCVFVAVAFAASRVLTSAGGFSLASLQDVAPVLVASLIIQIGVFCTRRIYRSTYRAVSIGEVLSTVKTVGIAVLGSALIIRFLVPADSLFLNAAFWIVDFYLLATFAAGARFAFRVLSFFFRRGLGRGRKAVIFGANMYGLLTLESMLQSGDTQFDPIGFIDDNPALEGTTLNGFPVLGGRNNLLWLVRKMQIRDIILAPESCSPEARHQLLSVAGETGIRLQETRFSVDDVGGGSNADPSAAKGR